MHISASVIDTIVEWINENLHRKLSIEEISIHSGYSKWHIQRLFFHYKGENLASYIRRRKMELAVMQLTHTDACIYDVALACGYDSQQTFTRVFSRTFGLSPGAWRKERRKSMADCLRQVSTQHYY